VSLQCGDLRCGVGGCSVLRWVAGWQRGDLRPTGRWLFVVPVDAFFHCFHSFTRQCRHTATNDFFCCRSSVDQHNDRSHLELAPTTTHLAKLYRVRLFACGALM